MHRVRMAVVVCTTATMLMGADGGGCFGIGGDDSGSGGQGAGGSGGSGGTTSGPCSAYCAVNATQCSDGSQEAISLCTDECSATLSAADSAGCKAEFTAYITCLTGLDMLDCSGEGFDCPDELTAFGTCEGGGS